MSDGRVLPHSLEAEEYLLSSIFLDGPDVLTRAEAAGITADSLYDLKHGIVYAGMRRLMAAGIEISPATLAEELKTARELDQVGGYAFLAQVSSRIPTTAQSGYFIEKVAEQATLRLAIRSATGIVEDCYGFAGGTVEDHIGRKVSALANIVSGQVSAREKKWGEVVDEALGNVSALCAPALASRRTVSLGWPSLDIAFEPARLGQLVIIGARPSIGKSSLLRPIAYGAAKHGQHVYFATLEVKPSSIAMQFAATLSGIGVRRLAKAHSADQAQFRKTLEELRALPIHVHDTRHTLAAITAKARALQARRPLDLVVIDYLGLIADCDIGDHKPSAVGRVTKALKRLAGELDCVVLVACQLSRLSATEKNREPRLTDLRDSGDIEQDADKVIFIHRPDTDPITGMSQSDTSDKNNVPTFFQNLIQAKGRDDGTGLASFYFKRETATFYPALKKSFTPVSPAKS